jgi:hypothetical protein
VGTLLLACFLIYLSLCTAEEQTLRQACLLLMRRTPRYATRLLVLL